MPRFSWKALLLASLIALLASFIYATEISLLGSGLVALGFLFFYLLFRILWLGRVAAASLSLALLLAIYAASKFKYWLTARRLHPHDLYLYLDLDTLLYIRDLFPHHYLYLYVGIPLAIAMLAALVFFEGIRAPTKATLGAFAAVTVILGGLGQATPYLEDSRFFWGNRFMHWDFQHTSTFIFATAGALPDLVRGKAFDYGVQVAIDPQDVATVRAGTCMPPAGPAPDIILSMRESAMIPAAIESMGVAQVGPERFRSSDGKTYRLQVETHGGGSAFSIFSVLTGLSSEAFGAMKNIGIDLSLDRMTQTLPQFLETCGYRTTAFSMGTEGYVIARRFYESVGFDRYKDLGDVKAFSGGDYSDKSVYALADATLDTDERPGPAFIYVETTVAHAPYDSPLRPEEHVPEADGIADPIVREYVRRLMIAEHDLDRFIVKRAEAAKKAGRPLVVLDFGDHQPPFTKDLPGFPGHVDYGKDSNDPLLATYFRIRTFGKDLPKLPDHPIVDVAFIPDWLLHAAGVGSDGLYRLRWEMVEECRSRYWRCEEGQAAYRLHQTMREAGVISIP